MKRTVAIASCLTLLCLAAIAVWVYVKRTGHSGAPVPEGNTSTEKRGTDPRVFELPVQIAFLDDDQFIPCYLDLENKTLYRWKGVVLRGDQLPDAYKHALGRIRILEAKDFTVVPVEAPVKYRETEGGYRPGYLDWSAGAFYEWKGVVLSKQEVPDKNQDGQSAVVGPDASIEVIAINIPAHLKDKPELWKKH